MQVPDSTSGRWRALGGVVGPAAFIGAWATLGTGRPGYSPVEDPISRLAAIGASTRPGMTAGMLALGAGLALYATEVRRTGQRQHGATPVAIAAATTAIATFGVAGTPLESSLGDHAHAAAAAVAYASLAAVPGLAARGLAMEGRRRLAAASAVAAGACGTSLLLSVLPIGSTGLFQRVGLTTGHAWIMASAAWLAFRPATRRAPT